MINFEIQPENKANSIETFRLASLEIAEINVTNSDFNISGSPIFDNKYWIPNWGVVFDIKPKI